MTRASVSLHAAKDRLAEARDRFLAAEPVDQAAVRKPILASWWRSRQWNVAADHVDLSYLRDPDLETTLARTADPVLRHLHEQLDGQPISIILTDAAGMVLTRLTADHDLERALDGIKLAPGFSYAEERVGTNGIGTALESGGPAHVFGHEHYAESLERFGCAGVPIHDPVSGKTVGVIDLTCWRKNADPLLLSLVKSTADQITQALLAAGSSRDLHLLQEYVRACRRTGGIVLALGNDVVMLNDHARRVLDPGDQSALIGHATEALARQNPGAVTVDLPSGVTARMFCRRISGGSPYPDGVVHVKLVAAAAVVPEVPAPRAAMYLPGLVGSGVLWLRACREAEALYDASDWMTLEGEGGVGKLALARAVHQRRNPAAPFHVLDAEAADQEWLTKTRRELLEGTGMLVIRHADALTPKQMHSLASALQEARSAERQHRAPGSGDAEPQAGQRGPDPAAAVLPGHGGASAAAAPHRGPARAGALLPGPAEPAGPPDLLAGGDAAAAAAQLAGQLRTAVAGSQAGRAAPPGRRDHAAGPAAGVLDGEPQAAVPAGVHRAGRDRAEPARP